MQTVNCVRITFETPCYWGRGRLMKSLGVCTFFGSGGNRLQEEPGFAFEDATPPAVDGLSVEWQPAFSDRTAQHVNNRQ